MVMGTWILGSKDFDVVEELARLSLDADRAERLAFLGGCGHPDLVAGDDRRRPAFTWNRSLPDDGFGFTPSQGNALGIGVPLPVGATELRPVGVQASREAAEDQEGGGDESHDKSRFASRGRGENFDVYRVGLDDSKVNTHLPGGGCAALYLSRLPV